MTPVEDSVDRVAGAGGMPRAAPAVRALSGESLRRVARRFPGITRRVGRLLQRVRARTYRLRRRLGGLPRIAGSAHARLGVYVAYFDASEIYRLHLSAFRRTTSGAFNYYVMKNCTTGAEARRFDEMVSEFGFPRVFTPRPARVTFSHGESLQRMVDRTTDEIVVVCDVDAFPIAPGWDDVIVRELATKDAVGAIVHIPDRRRLRTFLHPCFLAFRRSFLDAHALDLLGRADGDPCHRITEWLVENGRFHEGCVTPLLPTAHERELWPGFTHAPAFGSRSLRHGLGTTYGGLVLHLWYWRHITRRRPVREGNGPVLVDVAEMERVLASLRARLGGTERAPSAPA